MSYHISDSYSHDDYSLPELLLHIQAILSLEMPIQTLIRVSDWRQVKLTRFQIDTLSFPKFSNDAFNQSVLLIQHPCRNQDCRSIQFMTFARSSYGLITSRAPIPFCRTIRIGSLHCVPTQKPSSIHSSALYHVFSSAEPTKTDPETPRLCPPNSHPDPH